MNKKRPVKQIIYLTIVTLLIIGVSYILTSHPLLTAISLVSSVLYLIFGIWAIVVGFKLVKDKKSRGWMISNFILGVLSLPASLMLFLMYSLEMAIMSGP